jgi:beta-glucosidase
MVNGFQEYALQTRLGIPLLYGVDAVHGHNNVIGAVIFPHNIGLGATRNPELVEQIGWATAGARSIMASFSSWNGTKVHADKYLLTDLLKDELGFTGFVVSDWGAIDQIDPDYCQAVVTAINAGIDLNVVPYDYRRFGRTLQEAVENGDVSQDRIDDAVRRILRVKFELGLFEYPFTDEESLVKVGSEEHRDLAREAVNQSLVLLKNEGGVLPISEDTTAVFVGGQAADDIGIQSGGWTIEWQGQEGDITEGMTILEAIQSTAPEGTVEYFDSKGLLDSVQAAEGSELEPDVCIGVVGERPYAEGVGDSAELALPADDLNVLENLQADCPTLVVILLSGRPLIITNLIEEWDGLVAAWLPGTEGQGVADVLFGHQPFTGKLPYTWPCSIDQLPFNFANLSSEGCSAPLFPFGYGLEADNNEVFVIPGYP